MFTFTTTNVINSNKDLTTGKALWVSTDETAEKCASFNVKRVNNFLADNVLAIYKAEASEPEMAKVTIDLSNLTDAQDCMIYRLVLYIGLTQASQDSRYSNDLLYKGKPLSCEFMYKTDAATTAEKLVKTINKYQLMVYGEKLLDVSCNGSCITIEAKTEYQRFRVVNIDKLDPDAYFGMGEFIPVRTLEDIAVKDSNEEVTDSEEGYFVGKEGFGTFSYILHNLRIPTHYRTDAFAINQEESPIPGALYNQYTIHYCVNRGPLGMNAVGEVTKSVTVHVFYVKSDLCADFEAGLEKLTTIQDAGPGLDTLMPKDLVSTEITLSREIANMQTGTNP